MASFIISIALHHLSIQHFRFVFGFLQSLFYAETFHKTFFLESAYKNIEKLKCFLIDQERGSRVKQQVQSDG